MGKYLKLFRLEDQYTQVAFAVAAGIVLRDRSWAMVWWIAAVLFLSFTAFIVNEIVDREDTDTRSWNTYHIGSRAVLNMNIVRTLFIVCTVVGMGFAVVSGLWTWGLAMFFVGVAYSLPPIRLKARIGGDIVAQLAVWCLIPFLAPIVAQGKGYDALQLLFPLSCVVWSTFYPYQLADFVADKQSGLINTHVWLGLRRSVWFGCGLGILGLSIFIGNTWMLTRYVFLIPFLCMQVIALGFYGYWISLKNEQRLGSAIQKAIIMMKPYAPLILLIWALWWLIW